MAGVPNPPTREMENAGFSSVIIGWLVRLWRRVMYISEGSGIVFPTGNRAVQTNASGELAESAVTSTELNYLQGTTSNIQNQLDAKLFISQTGSSTTGWEDMRVPVSSTIRGGTKDPTWTKITDDGAGSQGVFTYAFSATTEEELYFAAQLPHSYKAGTDIKPHVHWAPSDANTGNVVWGVEYVWINEGDTIGNSTILKPAGAAAPGVALKHQIHPLGTMTGTGKRESSVVLGRVFRAAGDAGDTYPSVAHFFGIDFHFQVEKAASVSEYP